MKDTFNYFCGCPCFKSEKSEGCTNDNDENKGCECESGGGSSSGGVPGPQGPKGDTGLTEDVFVRKTLIRNDGSWVSPKRGYYNFEICGGGGGGYIGNCTTSNTLYKKGGGSGGLRFETIFMDKGDTAKITIGDGGLGGYYSNGDKVGTDGGDTIVTIGGRSFISTGGKFIAGYNTMDNSIPSAGGIPNGVDGEAIQQTGFPAVLL